MFNLILNLFYVGFDVNKEKSEDEEFKKIIKFVTIFIKYKYKYKNYFL